jgi:acyl-CoA reductase-like NAD-dependent aldehyde dehydrogenase
LAVITIADSLEEAIDQANNVPHGLLAAFWGGDDQEQQYFMEHTQAGMLRLADAPLVPNAPFCGWKASALGPPEHGRWDREFYARPQALMV